MPALTIDQIWDAVRDFEYPVYVENDLFVIFPTDYHFNPYVGMVLYSESENMEYILSDIFAENDELRIFRCQWIENDIEEEPYDSSENVSRYSLDDGYPEENLSEDSNNNFQLKLGHFPGREIPLVSLEQEFSGNGDAVSSMLFDVGLTSSRYAEVYHNSQDRIASSRKICYVETDSSCGYELIFDRIDFSNESNVTKVQTAQSIMRQLREEGQIRLSSRCGFHVHVDVSNWSMDEICSAYHLWNYMEDTVFRFASAFWHCHRDEEVGGGYSCPVPKGATGKKEIAMRALEGRDALNFANILRAKTSCHCGACMYEDWANCTCNLRQPTLEFRVFNATLNQRKIRAYVAFCVAFCHMAAKNAYNPVDFPQMRWQGTHSMEDGWEEESKKRIEFILSEFPLTEDEKRDVIYCFENSSLAPIMELLTKE